MEPLAAWWPRDVLEVSGPDAVTFLQGQLSQDVAAVPVGGSALSFVLQPQGKVDALVRITRTAEDAVVVDVDSGYGEAVAARLARFKLRVKADIRARPWRCLALRGDGSVVAPERTPDGGVPDVAVLDVAAWWPGVAGVDRLGEAPEVPAGYELVDAGILDQLRIRAGVPVMGKELTERTIPAETGWIDRTVSFTKGCYTGQELVARIDSRGGHVPRHLRRIELGGGAEATSVIEGARILAGGRHVGEVTSVAGGWALGYVHRDVEPPADATVTWDGGEVQARIWPLPAAAPEETAS